MCLIVLLVSIGLEWYGHACGFLVTSDSLQYLSAAHSFSKNGKFLSPDGSYYSYWPPLFPIILSFFKQPQIALEWINVACKMVMTLILLHIVTLFINDAILKIIFLIASLISVHMAMISVFVWSELIFMTLVFMNAYFVLHLNKHPSNFYWLLLTGFLACIQRNAGLFWISGVCLWLLLYSPFSLKARVLKSVICFLVCTAGLWGWNIYNTFFLPADFNFYKHDFFAYTPYNLISTLNTLGKMVMPFDGIAGILVGIFLVVAIFIQFILFKKSDRNAHFLGIVFLAYMMGFLIMPGHLDIFEMDRYFSVLAPIVYLFIISLVQEKVQPINLTKRIWIYVIVFVWLCYPVTRTFRNVQAWHERSCNADMSR
ncbi:MAG: hypothetical protein HY015_03440 [Bacteroidetes bacterium]|nr:hypothetical protein [Bacteroidota bacterium]